jgi:hypothetical protein
VGIVNVNDPTPEAAPAIVVVPSIVAVVALYTSTIKLEAAATLCPKKQVAVV